MAKLRGDGRLVDEEGRPMLLRWDGKLLKHCTDAELQEALEVCRMTDHLPDSMLLSRVVRDEQRRRQAQGVSYLD